MNRSLRSDKRKGKGKVILSTACIDVQQLVVSLKKKISKKQVFVSGATV